MKKLLNILGICGLISTPWGSLTACSGNKKLQYLEEAIPETTNQEQEDNINNVKITIHLLNHKINILNQQINIKKIKKLQNNILQLKAKIKELKKTLEQAELRNIKEINLLDLKIKVGDIEKVKESEIRPYLQAAILTVIRQQLNATITENDFSFNFNDYFNQNQPWTINLAKKVNNYVINIVGYNNAKNSIKLEILFPKTVYKIVDFTSFTKIKIPSPEDRLPKYPNDYFTAWLLEDKIRTQFLKQIQKIDPNLSENDFTIVFEAEPYKSRMFNLRKVFINDASKNKTFDITIIWHKNAKGKFTTTINLIDFYIIE
ncbi:hypothetical protein [Spiroplasma phoeniceum]|uniref:Lipoprotein n=1 Tax=Spiroplasma phoeniceum P40 TaxID=1276259 RepID=A0A345DRR5_9MOLU|nr:hypothetical protein [Spiroplasma phoeniceum]AXF96906.1 hypothetical protein SDAV_001966 [Spiroplasma phoeniceum P40]